MLSRKISAELPPAFDDTLAQCLCFFLGLELLYQFFNNLVPERRAQLLVNSFIADDRDLMADSGDVDKNPVSFAGFVHTKLCKNSSRRFDLTSPAKTFKVYPDLPRRI